MQTSPSIEMPGLDLGVSNGARTRDIRHHKATLYQLSYTHHGALTSGREARV